MIKFSCNNLFVFIFYANWYTDLSRKEKYICIYIYIFIHKKIPGTGGL